ncbi:general transcription factor IIE subunit 2-like [Pelobates fuscus]|uniref:general transcription factor IIE subunit 2-like n=1 Tax=Pelobates fuscus TaxID=191477 RepID=UPI002FE47C6A
MGYKHWEISIQYRWMGLWSLPVILLRLIELQGDGTVGTHRQVYALVDAEVCLLDETQHLDIGIKQKQWLMSEALVNNPKIEITDGKYYFKPTYNLKDKKALLRLLDKHDQRGLGGILLDDIEEGLPNAQKAIKALGDQIVFVTRPDKKKILIYNDKSCQFSVDEEFQKLWRSVPVDSMDDEKIEEYLKIQGIASMQESGPKKVIPVQKRKKSNSQKRRFKTHNDHLACVLKDYTDVTPGKP